MIQKPTLINITRVEHLIGIGQKQAGAHRVRNRTQLRKIHMALEKSMSHTHTEAQSII